jgi:hypothetical protein
MPPDFRTLLLDAFPESTWPVMARGVREGVRIADDVRRSIPFLTTDVGTDLKGMLRRAAVMWRMQALCRAKEIPFKAIEIRVDNAPVHLLSMTSKKFELHIVRTDDIDAFPDEAQIREYRRSFNTADLFVGDGKLVPLHKVLEETPTFYGWITWGANTKGDLTHLGLAVPDNDQNTWLAQFDILKHLAMRESTRGTAPRPSAPNPALMLKFREEIARSLEEDRDEGEPA